MTYVGATPTTGDFKLLDSITTSSTTTFNLRQGGVAVYPQSANHCLVVLNGVLQTAGSSFNIVNDTIVFASSLSSSDVINQILVLGNVNDIGVVSDDTVSTAKLQANAVTAAKFNADVISGQTELATTPADTDELLLSDAGVLKRIDYSHLKSNPGLVLLKEYSLSSGSTVSFVNGTDGVDLGTGTYRYLVWIWSCSTSAACHMEFQFSQDAGSNYNSNISCASRVLAERNVGADTQNTFASSAGTDGDTVSNATDFQKMTWYQTTAGGYKFHGKLELWNPQTTFPHWNAEAYYASSGNNIVNTKTHGWINNDGGGDIDGFQLKPSTGNFDDGQIAMYGYRRT
jgi:hypothetical protein